jgi:hypothetical protein
MYGLVDEVAAIGECDPTEVGGCGAAWSAAEDISLDAAHGGWTVMSLIALTFFDRILILLG